MGKTYKRYPITYFRHPRGAKQAKIAGGRPGAVPPDVYDDGHYDCQCYYPFDIAKRLIKEGWDGEKVAKRLARKFRLPAWQAKRIVKSFVRWDIPKPDWWY